MYVFNDDIADPSNLGFFALLQVNTQTASISELGGWLDIANNLTVTAILLLGLYFLNKMKEKTEEKREKYISDLMEKMDKSHSEKVSFLSEQLRLSEEERRSLRDKLID